MAGDIGTAKDVLEHVPPATFFGAVGTFALGVFGGLGIAAAIAF